MMIIEKNLMIESEGVTGSGDARQSLKADVTQNRRVYSVLSRNPKNILSRKSDQTAGFSSQA